MTLKPNRRRAFLKTFVLVSIFISIMTLVVRLSSGAFEMGDVLFFTIVVGTISGLMGAFLFTPEEMTWDDEGFRIRMTFPGSAEYAWGQLEAYSPFGRGLFLIKFEGKQAFQIDSAGFRTAEWGAFQQFLRQNFPTKKAWLWAGTLPMRFGNKKI